MKVLAKLMVILGVLFSGVVATSPNVAYAAKCEVDVKTGEWKAGGADCTKQADDLVTKIATFVKILSALVVAFAVGMIIYGGFKYVTSQGDPKATESAKMQIWFAGVGLFIVLTAFTILQLFLNAAGN